MRLVDELVSFLSTKLNSFLGIPGGAIGPFYDALHTLGITPINVRHETMACFMAHGIWQETKKPACVAVTSGPGLTNALTGLASAKQSRIPMWIVVGEVPTSKYGKGALQEGSAYGLSVKTLLEPVCDKVIEVRNPLQALYEIQVSLDTQGPVAIILPLDVALQEVKTVQLPIHEFPERTDMIVFAGSELMNSKEFELSQLENFLEATNSLLITSPKAKQLFVPNRTLGVFGYGGQSSVLEFLKKNSDKTILFLGADTDEVSTNNWSPLLRTKELIQVTSNSESLKFLNYVPDLFAWSSPQTLLEKYKDKKPSTLKTAFAVQSDIPSFGEELIHPAELIQEVQHGFPRDAIFTSDIGEHFLFATNNLVMNGQNKFVAATDFGSMGSGIGLAIGTALANRNKEVVCFCGDYGFQMFGMEFLTCVEQGLKNLTFVVFNDNCMTMVNNGQTTVFGKTPNVSTLSVDFARLKEFASNLVDTASVTKTETWKQDLQTAIKFKSSVLVLDCKIAKAKFGNNQRVETLSNFGK